MNTHLTIAPILIPFVAGTLLLALRALPLPLRRALAVISSLVQIAVALALLMAVSGGDILVYRLGDWPAPWNASAGIFPSIRGRDELPSSYRSSLLST